MLAKPSLEPTAAALKVSDDSAVTNSPSEIKTGEWELGLFSCFEHCIPNCCMAWCCSCVSLAQISARLGLASYTRTLAALLALWLAFYVIYPLYLIEAFQSVEVVDTDSGRYYVATETPVLLNPARLAISAWGLAFVGFTAFLRVKTRTRFSIPGNLAFDVLASLCCSCCAVAQIASHVKSYTLRSCSFGPVDTLPAYPEQGNNSNAVVSAV